MTDQKLDPRITGQYIQVACGDCGREYLCTPLDDHYLRAGDPEGSPRVCEACLLRPPSKPVVDLMAALEKSLDDAKADRRRRQLDRERDEARLNGTLDDGEGMP